MQEKKRILLVNPYYQKETRWVTDAESHAQMGHDMVPLGLATIAALTPDDYEVTIWDEPVRGHVDESDLDGDFDLIGITGYRAHLSRAAEVSDYFRSKGILVTIGGPGVSGSPDRCRGDFDVLFIGEAELTWPQFLCDWKQGKAKAEYRQIEKPDLTQSPIPRWDSLADTMHEYAMGCVQTTRGCPFDCEFCDVIYLYGRRQRHKHIEQVIEEIKVLEKLGLKGIFFSDDEFVGDPKYAKELLRAVIPVNNAFEQPLSFSTQMTINVCKDEELMELIADANFYLVFIGLETSNQDSLRETGKFQNVREDLVADAHKVLSYGIGIRAGTIVGFDHDDLSCFDTQAEFIQKASLPSVSLNMLKAAIGTRLWTRLRCEGRVIDVSNVCGQGLARVYTNIIPKLMTRVELMTGFRDMMKRVYSWTAFTERMLGWMDLVKREPRVRATPVSREDFLRLKETLPLESEGLEAIDVIYEYTAMKVPYMLHRVRDLVIQQAHYRESVGELLEEMSGQIQRESEGIEIVLDGRPAPIPEGFRKAFQKQIFPPVYRRVSLNLDHKEKTPVALNGVFVDFLVRWGNDFEELEPHHLGFLHELVDRTCAELNGSKPELFEPVTEGEVDMRTPARERLWDDVLKSVEQDLVQVYQNQGQA